MRIIHYIFSVLLFGFVLTASAKNTDKFSCYANDQLVDTMQKVNGIYLLDLQGGYDDMGYCYGKLAAPELKALLANAVGKINYQAPLNKFFIWAEKHTLPRREKDLLTGISAGSGISYDDVIKINFATDLLFIGKRQQAACSVVMMAKNRTSTGHVLVGRNYDLPKYFASTFMPYTAIVRYHPVRPDHAVAVVGPLGMVSGLSALSDAGLFNEINSGLIAFPFPRINPFALPNPMIQNFEAMLSANNIEDLHYYYRHHVTPVGALIGIANADIGYHFERTPYQDGKSLQVDEHDAIWLSPSVLRNDIYTNTYKMKSLLMKHLTLAELEGPSMAQQRLSHLQAMIRHHSGQWSPMDMQSLMLTYFTNEGAYWPSSRNIVKGQNEATSYSLVVSPYDRSMWLYVEGVTKGWLKYSM